MKEETREGLFDDNKVIEGSKNYSEEQELMKRLEAALFLAARFLTIDELVRITGINPISTKELLDKLEKKHRGENSAMRIIKQKFENEELFKMDVKKGFDHMVNRIVSGDAEFNKAEQETLAIIAYKQPIKQSVIVKIRGNKAYDHIRHCIAVGLVRGKKAGRTVELNLTQQFYEYFNLNPENGVQELGK